MGSFQYRSYHSFQIARLPDYLGICLLKDFLMLNTYHNNYGLSKLAKYWLTMDLDMTPNG